MAGNLRMTRPYVPARALWGALTARLAGAERSPAEFVRVGEQVNDELALGYLYPSQKATEVSVWPWEPQFAWLYLGSWMSTAISERRTHEEASLHETEMIGERTRLGERVYLVGEVWQREDSQLGWRGVLDMLELGGERAYGWGRVSVEACVAVGAPEVGPRPTVDLQPNEPLRAHLRARQGLAVEGGLEPLVAGSR